MLLKGFYALQSRILPKDPIQKEYPVMNFFQKTFVYLLICSIFFICSPAFFAQETRGALLRGYRTGYSDGYMSGYRDTTEHSARDFARHPDYQKADRVYRNEYGALEEYRDGYQQGFEAGYNSGFDRREFDSALPANLSRRAAEKLVLPPSVESSVRDNRTNIGGNSAPILQENPAQPNTQPPTANLNPASGQPTIIIPTNTEIIVEMLADVSTENSREGDSFLARIVAPEEIKGAIIEGRVAKIKRPGRVTGNAELQLSFSRIVVNETRWANFNAIVIEALSLKGNNIKAIDEEGTVTGKSSLKSDAVKVGAATGTGAVVGAIAGGPVGAAIGAAVGGAFGVGGVLVSRGKEINLAQGQQIRVRTNFESQIR